MGAGDISGGASLWRPTTSRHIAPSTSVNDPVDFFVTHFQGPSRREPATSRRDIAPSVNTTYQFILAADVPSATPCESPADRDHSQRNSFVWPAGIGSAHCSVFINDLTLAAWFLTSPAQYRTWSFFKTMSGKKIHGWPLSWKLDLKSLKKTTLVAVRHEAITSDIPKSPCPASYTH